MHTRTGYYKKEMCH